MFCYNCGNKLEDGTVSCDKCGTVFENNNYKKSIKKENTNTRGVISLILGIVSIIMCFDFMLKDISNVGMYTEIIERLYYAFNLVLAPLFLAFITLIISYGGKECDKALNKTGLFLSIISLIMVTLEIVIVVIY